jgi:hypothetical protein
MKPWQRRFHRQLLVARREVKRLVAIAEGCTVEAESPRAAPHFRALAEAEAEAILGAELLATLTRLKAERRSY